MWPGAVWGMPGSGRRAADYSCTLPIWSVGERAITTVEGLGTCGRLHPVAQAFVDAQAAQCGYCTSGMIIGAVGLLAENDAPTEDEVRAALDRNLCRCGAHNRIVRAVCAVAGDRPRDDG